MCIKLSSSTISKEKNFTQPDYSIPVQQQAVKKVWLDPLIRGKVCSDSCRVK